MDGVDQHGAQKTPEQGKEKADPAPEIAGEAGISRQAVYDTLARAESALRTMEGRVGAVARDLACRKALARIRQAAETLAQSEDPVTAGLAGEILEAGATLKE